MFCRKRQHGQRPPKQHGGAKKPRSNMGQKGRERPLDHSPGQRGVSHRRSLGKMPAKDAAPAGRQEIGYLDECGITTQIH